MTNDPSSKSRSRDLSARVKPGGLPAWFSEVTCCGASINPGEIPTNPSSVGNIAPQLLDR